MTRLKKLPDLHTSRHDRSIQDQVEARIRQLSNTDVKGTDPKYKSQRGGSMDIFVKERVKWPHEFVLAGSTKDRTRGSLAKTKPPEKDIKVSAKVLRKCSVSSLILLWQLKSVQSALSSTVFKI